MHELRSLITVCTILLAALVLVPVVSRAAMEVLQGIDGPAAGSPSSTPVIEWTTVLSVGAAAGAVLVLCAGVWWLRNRRAAERVRVARRNTQLETWRQGLAALDETSEAVCAFEGDPESVYFTRWLLADVNEPATAAFYTAYDAALSLRTESVPVDTEAITAFVDAATAARRAFGVADENARRKARLGISHNGECLTRDERRKIEQARKLMRLARDPSLAEDNARNAYAKAQSLLDNVGVVVPERLMGSASKSIEAVRQKALTS